MDVNITLTPEMLASVVGTKLSQEHSIREAVVARAAHILCEQASKEHSTHFTERAKDVRLKVDAAFNSIEEHLVTRLSHYRSEALVGLRKKFEGIGSQMEVTMQEVLGDDRGATLVAEQLKQLLSKNYGHEIGKMCRLAFSNMSKMLKAESLLEDSQ